METATYIKGDYSRNRKGGSLDDSRLGNLFGVAVDVSVTVDNVLKFTNI